MNIPPYDERTVLVTGAASGIGSSIARAALGTGAATVWLADVDEARLETLADTLRKTPGQRVATHVCDIAHRDEVETLFATVAESGPLDVAFLNAGINRGPGIAAPGGGVDEFDPTTWREVMDVNLDGFFTTLQHSARIMKAQRSGSIVITASTAGTRAEPLLGYAYVASKSAVVGLTRQAALELAQYGVRVNAVAPGPINTRIGGDGPRPAAKTAAFEESIPLGRWGEGDEVAALAVFLGSDEASFCTGGIYPVDGGAGALTQVLGGQLVREP